MNVDSRLSLHGIFPPMVTPLNGPDSLDMAGTERLIEHMLAGGVHGLFILGTTGEGPGLSYRVRRELIQHVCTQVNERVSVLVGVTDTSHADLKQMIQTAAEHGAVAAVVAPPYYSIPSQEELVSYYRRVADESPLPIVPYNMPSCTKVHIELDTLRKMIGHPNILAYKDSSGRMLYFQQVLHLLKEFPGKTALMGPDELLTQALLLGGHGGISGGANLFPRLYVDLYDAAMSGDLLTLRRLQAIVIQVSSMLTGDGSYGSIIIKNLKSGLSCLNICDNHLTEPFGRIDDEAFDAMRRCVSEVECQLASV